MQLVLSIRSVSLPYDARCKISAKKWLDSFTLCTLVTIIYINVVVQSELFGLLIGVQ